MKNAINAAKQYSFLLGQLVSRDFKTRYKRSVFGVIWSMLNPLLMMCVQYLIFSNLFRFQIENYAVYLLIGTVTFNFFSESTQMALGSIIQSASLITKVYIPACIFPISKIIASGINLAFSTLALYVIIFIQGIPLSFTHLLIPVLYIMLAVFSFGIGLILASVTVYFRDMQFIYNVVVVVWTYLTPLFYSADIIPQQFQALYQANPMYQYVTFFRTLVLEQQIPSLERFIWCAGYAVLFALIGWFIYKKTKKNFILNV